MSLTSRVANLFNSSSPEQLAPSDETRPTGSFDVGNYGETESTQFPKDRRKLQAATMEEEEEARPPYVHVRLYHFETLQEPGDLTSHSRCLLAA